MEEEKVALPVTTEQEYLYAIVMELRRIRALLGASSEAVREEQAAGASDERPLLLDEGVRLRG